MSPLSNVTPVTMMFYSKQLISEGLIVEISPLNFSFQKELCSFMAKP